MLSRNVRMGAVFEQAVVVVSGGIPDRGVGVVIEFPPTDKICRAGGAGLNGAGSEADRGSRPGVSHPVGGLGPKIVNRRRA